MTVKEIKNAPGIGWRNGVLTGNIKLRMPAV